jgi:hypothetical protein
MKFFVRSLAVLVISLLLGLGSAWLMIYHPPLRLGVKNGSWQTNLEVGSREANLYLRAYVARIGLFALNKTETIYYLAETDDTGEPLRSVCNYRIQGQELPARWWSITVYGADNFLIPNALDRYSFNMKSVTRDSDGTYAIRLSRTRQPGDWLPAGEKDQRISLSLRCYNPKPVMYEEPEKIALPRILKEDCP